MSVERQTREDRKEHGLSCLCLALLPSICSSVVNVVTARNGSLAAGLTPVSEAGVLTQLSSEDLLCRISGAVADLLRELPRRPGERERPLSRGSLGTVARAPATLSGSSPRPAGEPQLRSQAPLVNAGSSLIKSTPASVSPRPGNFQSAP